MIAFDRELEYLKKAGENIDWLLLLKAELEEEIDKIYPANYNLHTEIRDIHYTEK